MSKKPNCYECKYRHDLPGDAHSRCAHPRIPKFNGMMQIYMEMTSGVKQEGVPLDQAIKVTGNAHGIRSGWFMWPANFDPTWLVSCDGFEAKGAGK